MSRKYRRNYRSRNGLTPSMNRAIGRFTYGVILLILISIGFKLWSTNIFDDTLIAVLGMISFGLTGWILRKLNIWLLVHSEEGRLGPEKLARKPLWCLVVECSRPGRPAAALRTSFAP